MPKTQTPNINSNFYGRKSMGWGETQVKYVLPIKLRPGKKYNPLNTEK